MIIAQLSAPNVSTMASTGATQVFQNNTTQNPSLAAGNASLSVGKGLILGLPFEIGYQFTAAQPASGGTNYTAKARVVIAPFGTVIGSGTNLDGTASAALSNAAAATFVFAAIYEVVVDYVSGKLVASSRSLQGDGTGTYTAEATAGGGTLTGYTADAGGFSWPAKITGLDTAIQNGPIFTLWPEIVTSAASTGSLLTFQSMYVKQG